MTNPTVASTAASGLAGECRAAVPAALLEQLAGRGALAERFRHFQQAFHDEQILPARLLELCRTRIDALHQVSPASTLDPSTAESVARGDFQWLSPEEQQALNLAEQLTIDAHGVSDAQVTELAAAIGEPATVTLLTAVALHDSNIRMQRVLEALSRARANSHPKEN